MARLPRRLAIMLGVLAAAGCGAPVRSSPLTRYQGMLLNDQGLGAQALATQAAGDATMQRYLEEHGKPSFVYVADPDTTQLIYTWDAKVVTFRRSAVGAPAVMGVTSPLPSGLLSLLPSDVSAGTGGGDPTIGLYCWTVPVGDESCRTCCKARPACSSECTAR